jgi:hypothetical protein
VNNDWSDDAIAQAAEKLEPDFPRLSKANLTAAVQLCVHDVPPENGIAELVAHARAFLRKSGARAGEQ